MDFDGSRFMDYSVYPGPEALTRLEEYYELVKQYDYTAYLFPRMNGKDRIVELLREYMEVFGTTVTEILEVLPAPQTIKRKPYPTKGKVRNDDRFRRVAPARLQPSRIVPRRVHGRGGRS